MYDIPYLGFHFLPQSHPGLKIVPRDIRETAKLTAAFKGTDAVITLACISNDASFGLDEQLSTSINLNAFEPIVVGAKQTCSKGRVKGAPRRYSDRGRHEALRAHSDLRDWASHGPKRKVCGTTKQVIGTANSLANRFVGGGFRSCDGPQQSLRFILLHDYREATPLRCA